MLRSLTIDRAIQLSFLVTAAVVPCGCVSNRSAVPLLHEARDAVSDPEQSNRDQYASWASKPPAEISPSNRSVASTRPPVPKAAKRDPVQSAVVVSAVGFQQRGDEAANDTSSSSLIQDLPNPNLDSEAELEAEVPDRAEEDAGSVAPPDGTPPSDPAGSLPSPRGDGVVETAPEIVPTPTMELIPESALFSESPEGLPLMQVVRSVHAYYPLVEAAYLERDRTAGDQLAAWGEFDTKLKLETEDQPLGFYETYRHGGGLEQPLYNGGQFFGGYRIGRGVFEPWYLERQTNEGGEFKAGFLVPLARNTEIDQRRAELWRATYDRQIAEPDIRNQLIGFVRDASTLYWQWVAAGQQYEIGRAALEIAQERNDRLQRLVDEGELDPPVLQDNLRAIAGREAKLFDRRRKLEQAAVKLSLFLRTDDASPLIPPPESLPPFLPAEPIDRERIDDWVATALRQRPELEVLTTMYRRTTVDLAQAVNDLKPTLDAGVVGSQDVGEPTSPKRDKSEFELELGLYFELPVQRRKGYGKLRSARAKLGQIDAKRQLTADKIATEVQTAVAALYAAYERVERTRRALQLAQDLAEIERRKFTLGESDLLSVFIREQFAIEAADELVVALLDYHTANVELTAAMGYQWPTPP